MSETALQGKNMSSTQDLIDLNDIADLIGVPRTYVRDTLVKNPEFPPPAIRLSQRIRRWSRASVRAWMEKQAETAAR